MPETKPSIPLQILIFFFGILCFSSFVLPPEGAVLKGDAVPLCLVWILLFACLVLLKILRPIPPAGTKQANNTLAFPGQKQTGTPCGKSRSTQASRTLATVPEPNSCFPPPSHQTRFRTGLPDILAILVLVWAGISWLALAVGHSGNHLYAARMFWEVALAILAYFFIRLGKELHAPAIETVFLAALTGAGIFESGLAIHQYYIADPAVREAFEKDPEGTLRENGLHFEKGSAEYMLFENRLMNSTEPVGSYCIANTLAGFLVPLLTLLAGAVLCKHSHRRTRGPLSSVLLFLLLAFVLLLTKSRAGYISLAAGVLGLVLFRMRRSVSESTGSDAGSPARHPRQRGRAIAGAVAVAIALATVPLVALKCGLLDGEVFSEAKKSLGYRLDYWTASCHMIADHPLLGVGPGNFQTSYTRYILPTAAETIADPHNVVFELGAVFGLPAAAAFLAFAISVLWSGFQSGRHPRAGKWHREPDWKIKAGFFTGCILLYAFLNLLTSAPVSPVFILLGFLPMLGLFIFAGDATGAGCPDLPTWVLMVAMCAALLNLCAASGICFAATALPIWGIAGILVNRNETVHQAAIPRKETPALCAVLILVCAGLALFQITACIPWEAEHKAETATKNATSGVTGFATGTDRSVASPEALYTYMKELARKTGGKSIPIQTQLFCLALDRYARDPNSATESEWRQTEEALVNAAPNSAAVQSAIGKLEIQYYERSQGKSSQNALLQAALPALNKAVELFPTNASRHALLGNALFQSGRANEAETEWNEANRLDQLTPHKDRKIDSVLRKRMESLRGSPPQQEKDNAHIGNAIDASEKDR